MDLPKRAFIRSILDKPENIVLNPATEYVAKFTSDVRREKVLRAGDVMDNFDGNEQMWLGIEYLIQSQGFLSLICPGA